MDMRAGCCLFIQGVRAKKGSAGQDRAARGQYWLGYRGVLLYLSIYQAFFFLFASCFSILFVFCNSIHDLSSSFLLFFFFLGGYCSMKCRSCKLVSYRPFVLLCLGTYTWLFYFPFLSFRSISAYRERKDVV